MRRRYHRLGQGVPAQPSIALIPVMHLDGSITYEVPSGPAAVAGDIAGTWLRNNWPWVVGGLAGFIVLKKLFD